MTTLAEAWHWWQVQWPGIYPNLIADALGGPLGALLAWSWAHRHVKRIHRAQQEHHQRVMEALTNKDRSTQ